MGSQTADLFKQYTALADDEKWRLAAQIFEDLHGPAEEGAEQAWVDEIDRRLDELDRGEARTVPWQQVNAKMQQLVDDKKR